MTDRRDFLKGAGAAAAAATLPLSLVELAFADATQNFHRPLTSLRAGEASGVDEREFHIFQRGGT